MIIVWNISTFLYNIERISPTVHLDCSDWMTRVPGASAMGPTAINYINPGYGLSLVDNLWNASSYRQPLEQEGNPMT